MSPEQKKLFGRRRADDDGFTYLYGKFKGGYGVKSKRDIDSIGKLVRHDKRAVKAAELSRTAKETEQEHAPLPDNARMARRNQSHCS